MRTALLLFAAAALAAPAPKAVGPDAVWAPPMGTNAALHDVCSKAAGEGVGACLRSFMKDAKVADAALAFSDKLPQPGYLSEFIARGKVDLGRVHFPFRANFNDTVYFLNGAPPMIDAYGPEVLKSVDLKKENVFLVPDGFTLPERIPTFIGIRYAAKMPERACRACSDLAIAEVAYDFTDAGVFKGARLMTLPPVKPGPR